MNDLPFDPEESRFDQRPSLTRELIGDHATAGSAERGDRDATPLEDVSGADTTPLAAMIREFAAEIRPEVCSDVMMWLDEEGLLARSRKAVANAGPEEQKWRPLAAKLLDTLRYIKEKNGGPVVTYAALHAWDIKDFDDLNGHLNQQQFADTIIVKYEVTRVNGREQRTPIYLTKAAVNNAVRDAQKHFQLPPRADQRNEETRAKQKDARVSQLQAA